MTLQFKLSILLPQVQVWLSILNPTLHKSSTALVAVGDPGTHSTRSHPQTDVDALTN